MNLIKTTLAAAAMAFALPIIAPVAAQQFPLAPGEYVEMSGITIKDGGSMKYAEWLATEWKRNQEYAKSQGWISDYKIYANVNARDGEPDIYLVSTFASLPDAAEQERREKAYDAWSKTTPQEREAASGNRAEYRTGTGSIMLQEYKPR